MARKKQTPMEKLTKGYEKFIEGKKANKNGKTTFDKTVKAAAAAATKQRVSK